MKEQAKKTLKPLVHDSREELRGKVFRELRGVLIFVVFTAAVLTAAFMILK
ncbi:hypothetical protein [Paenibacillus thermotolerans]|uniref:hypothetical protein n=1 Tax=Paenibacillus thermotolerans TaxID=3027807 RepID=UPI0023678F40|nr:MULTISPECIES: hypothetical protein [unclassified Paenibacillus]